MHSLQQTTKLFLWHLNSNFCWTFLNYLLPPKLQWRKQFKKLAYSHALLSIQKIVILQQLIWNRLHWFASNKKKFTELFSGALPNHKRTKKFHNGSYTNLLSMFRNNRDNKQAWGVHHGESNELSLAPPWASPSSAKKSKATCITLLK